MKLAPDRGCRVSRSERREQRRESGLHLLIEARDEAGPEFVCEACESGKCLVGIMTSTTGPGLALIRRNSPPNSLTLFLIPPIPMPVLSGRNSLSLSSPH